MHTRHQREGGSRPEQASAATATGCLPAGGGTCAGRQDLSRRASWGTGSGAGRAVHLSAWLWVHLRRTLQSSPEWLLSRERLARGELTLPGIALDSIFFSYLLWFPESVVPRGKPLVYRRPLGLTWLFCGLWGFACQCSAHHKPRHWLGAWGKWKRWNTSCSQPIPTPRNPINSAQIWKFIPLLKVYTGDPLLGKKNVFFRLFFSNL